jgi:hypothetical protein
MALVATTDMANVPETPMSGVPLNVAVAGSNVNPREGIIQPPRLTVGAGSPVVVTVNDPRRPAVKVALAALVIEGASLIVRVKLWVAAVPSSLVARKVIW